MTGENVIEIKFAEHERVHDSLKDIVQYTEDPALIERVNTMTYEQLQEFSARYGRNVDEIEAKTDAMYDAVDNAVAQLQQDHGPTVLIGLLDYLADACVSILGVEPEDTGELTLTLHAGMLAERILRAHRIENVLSLVRDVCGEETKDEGDTVE